MLEGFETQECDFVSIENFGMKINSFFIFYKGIMEGELHDMVRGDSQHVEGGFDRIYNKKPRLVDGVFYSFKNLLRFL